jgi:DegV family protein with EDD domain
LFLLARGREVEMQIVTDSAADISEARLEELHIYTVPLSIQIEGKTYRSGVDLQPDEFYSLLSLTESFPTTSQPSPGDFATLYRQLAQTDPDILSIHISSGLSGTLNAARAGASMVPEAHVTFFDSKTLSTPLGWMVQAAAYALRNNWAVERILDQLRLMQTKTQGLFTLDSMKYLIHGGRISHLKGLLASVLRIKPIIGPEKTDGVYATFGQEMTWKRVLNRLPEVVASMFSEGQRLRVQLLHGQNPEGVEILRQAISRKFICQFDPVAVVAPVLGAHTGPSLVGLGVGDPDVFDNLF